MRPPTVRRLLCWAMVLGLWSGACRVSSDGASTATTTTVPASTSTSGAPATTSRPVPTTTTTTPLTGPVVRAELSGAQAVPGPPDKGSASLTLSAERGRLCIELQVREVGTISAVHLHATDSRRLDVDLHIEGGGSPLARPQEPGRAASGRSGYSIRRTCPDVEASAIEAVVESPGRFVLDVHSVEFPDGAASGRLAA